ncbi:MAG: hypothetical protein JW850_05830 [Thermoflexales bacterium]|nr:hypothetical protein [Thermoflexales bacterium]
MIVPLVQEFDARVEWLNALITDPGGSRYFTKSQAERVRDLEAQLEHTADFLEFAGSPHKTFPAIHVAGTSGKGSVVTMIGVILAGCQLRTAWHTSPYLQVCIEKLMLDGRPIAPSEFIELVDRFRRLYESWRAAREDVSLCYVEAWAALTYMCFAQQAVDWAVIETSMGGRFDPTNVLPSRLAVITNIDFDHTEVLGSSLADIAYHKAGIIKENQVAITAATDATALRVIRQEAAQKNARLYCLGEDFDFVVKATAPGETLVMVRAPHRRYDDVRVGMSGLFQPANAALAVAAADVLAHEYGLPIAAESVSAALAEVRFAGRMEVIQSAPLVILDGAHNPHKMQALIDSLRAIYPGRKVVAVLGILMVKDARAMVSALLPMLSRVVVSQPYVPGKPSLPPQALAAIIRDTAPGLPLQVADSVQQGIALALEELDAGDLVLVTGSLYMVGEARNYWVPREQLLRAIEQGKHNTDAHGLHGCE